MSSPDAPGKLAEANIASAGSAELMPKPMEGTKVWSCDQKLIWVKLKPTLMLCDARVQVTVSPNCQTGALRRLGAMVLWALVMPSPALTPPAATLIPSAKPCWLATEPLKSAGLGSGKKSTV